MDHSVSSIRESDGATGRRSAAAAIAIPCTGECTVVFITRPDIAHRFGTWGSSRVARHAAGAGIHHVTYVTYPVKQLHVFTRLPAIQFVWKETIFEIEIITDIVSFSRTNCMVGVTIFFYYGCSLNIQSERVFS